MQWRIRGHQACLNALLMSSETAVTYGFSECSHWIWDRTSLMHFSGESFFRTHTGDCGAGRLQEDTEDFGQDELLKDFRETWEESNGVAPISGIGRFIWFRKHDHMAILPGCGKITKRKELIE